MKQLTSLILILVFLETACRDVNLPEIEFAQVEIALKEVSVTTNEVEATAVVNLFNITANDPRLGNTPVTKGFVWSTLPNPEVDKDANCLQGNCWENSQGGFAVVQDTFRTDDIQIIGLAPGFTYYIRAFLIIEAMPMHSAQQSFNIIWQELNGPPASLARYDATSFSLNEQAFVISGLREADGLPTSNFLTYRPQNGTSENWEISSLPPGFSAGSDATSFAFPDLAVTGLGKDHLGMAIGTTWLFSGTDPSPTPLPFTGPPGTGAVSFTIGRKGYAGTGKNGNTYFDRLWAFDADMQSWEASSIDLPADFAGRTEALAFSHQNTAYLGFGRSEAGVLLNDLWAYTEAGGFRSITITGPWPNPRRKPVFFIIGGKAYVGLGQAENELLRDIWEFDPQTETWCWITDLPSGAASRAATVFFSLEGSGFIYSGLDEDQILLTDFWRFTPPANQ